MPKRQEILSKDKLGGRIQALRLKKGLQRFELYDLVFGTKQSSNKKTKEYLTKMELYKERKYKETTVSNWEHDKSYPSIRYLENLCKALDCDSYYLFGLIDNPTLVADNLSPVTDLSVDFIQKLISYRNKYNGYVEDFSGTDDEMTINFELFFPEHHPDPRIQVLEYLYDERGLLKTIDAYVRLDSIDSVSINETSYATSDMNIPMR